MKGTVIVKLPKYRNYNPYGKGVKIEQLTVEADYTVVSDDKYLITAVRCPEGLPDMIYDDDFFEAIDVAYGMDLGEAEAIRRGLA
jgi:hypothetical protein